MNTLFARRQMIEQQVRAWDVLDHDILTVLADLHRERFVPSGYESLAFADTEIPLAHGEFMMTPTVEGRVLQTLELRGSERVLEVGTGSGFLTACLARLSDHVTSIDIHVDFVAEAQDKLADNGIDNIEILEMDATETLPEASFDAIAVTGSLQKFDPRLVDALAPGGRLFVVVGDAPVMEAKLVVRNDGTEWQSETVFETELAPLINGALPPRFNF